MELVSRHRSLLDALARQLLENEVLERADIDLLVAEHEGDIPPHERFEPRNGRRTDSPSVAREP